MWNGVCPIIKHHSWTLFSDAQRSGFWALYLRHNLIALIARCGDGGGDTLLAGPDLRNSPTTARRVQIVWENPLPQAVTYLSEVATDGN